MPEDTGAIRFLIYQSQPWICFFHILYARLYSATVAIRKTKKAVIYLGLCTRLLSDSSPARDSRDCEDKTDNKEVKEEEEEEEVEEEEEEEEDDGEDDDDRDKEDSDLEPDFCDQDAWNDYRDLHARFLHYHVDTVVKQSLKKIPGQRFFIFIRDYHVIFDFYDRLITEIKTCLDLFPEEIRDDILKSLTKFIKHKLGLIFRQLSVLQDSIEQERARRDAENKNANIYWNHITISRDQTSLSDFKREILLVLASEIERSSSLRFLNRRHTEPEHQENLQPHRLPERPEYRQPRNMKQHSTSSLSQTAEEHQRTAGNHTMSSQDEFVAAGVPQGRTPKEATTILARDTFNGDAAIPLGNDEMRELKHRLSLLETENQSLRARQEVNVRYETIYFIEDKNRKTPAAYHEEPAWSVGPRGDIAMKANFPLPDVEGYIKQKHDIAFFIAKFYKPEQQQSEVQKAVRDKGTIPRPKASNETIRLESLDMIEAMEAFIAHKPEFKGVFPTFNVRDALPAPYLFWYHYRSPEALDTMSDLHKKCIRELTAWIEENYGEMYDRVETQLKKGVVSYEAIEFLIKPGDAIVVKNKRGRETGTLNAEIAISRPSILTPQQLVDADTDKIWLTQTRENKKRYKWKWMMGTWAYRFDGSFYRKERSIEIEMQAEELHEEVDIRKLNVYPLKYARTEDLSPMKTKASAERFMVDFNTYRQLHSGTYAFREVYGEIDNDDVTRMDLSIMESDEPPPSPDIYAFPATIIGFNLRTKKWVDLEVDLIRDVSWNKQSFAHLVIDSETKELVQALITNQIEREQGTDIIESKGNGLIILLHGGPGTGKTFTAESVAEIAEKPLYRVTCGAIGTHAEDVEKYLESVLHLSKIWGCVVLLDEADVFLEQRTLTDLERNALVSVFLRVLEYYEGILILTSNRVGTFDEAFKSRIQLSLHYENLTRGQRYKIWKNFLNRLKEMDKLISTSATDMTTRETKVANPIAIDFEDVECYLSELAEFEMNGRQIRNAITTARQLAKFKKEQMNHSHLKHVIKVSGKFDTYLSSMREGLTDDQIARDEGVR
ncbi:hypothetical protein H2200_009807 [Cladophialophora chaetospira]|uniref:AAA+ ATPase domain-containing protein n=1 Tax=Cladophialophora chaetospira TaxID=386627 RepID=A0AA38X341_9EURO|nr:hypothetical protein H2200_009807 [Cladophialophora chaetospira]